MLKGKGIAADDAEKANAATEKNVEVRMMARNYVERV